MRPDYRVEKEFYHAGYKCVVIFRETGFRCGYVAIPLGHPLHGVGYSTRLYRRPEGLGRLIYGGVYFTETDHQTIGDFVNVHGGISYADSGDSGYPVEGLPGCWVLGFDCGHYDDGVDAELAEQYFGNQSSVLQTLCGQVRSFEFAENECKRLAEQLAEIEWGMP